MSNIQRAVFAKEALEVTGEAFETVRERMLKAVLDADSEPKAWQALLALRGWKPPGASSRHLLIPDRLNAKPPTGGQRTNPEENHARRYNRPCGG